MLFYYIRHGDPTYDPDCLTPLGRRQAESVGKRLACVGIDQIFASTSPRAGQTAAPCAELLKQDVTPLDFTNESHAWDDFHVTVDAQKGCWLLDAVPYRATLRSNEMRALGFEWYKHPVFSREDRHRFEQGCRRVADESDAFLENLGYRHDRAAHRFIPLVPNEDRVALFAHAGFGHAFIMHILDLPYVVSEAFAMTHTGVTVIDFRVSPDGFVYPKMLKFSDTSHLACDGLPITHCNNLRV